ncbi:alpha/beta fold hydrolase [Streptomyces aidingensis]|uniref:Pimeloyl-ACP methyl ester carboxylesterase n=1 Tax=Streptomyces aidingensis TaxID=910347 RepID=A0A1I1QDK0_9ACTN|nr:alpha/beta hydrolase [Streptomyces aidingensis]SFD20159.1 Pimeloyl-ACP methyl ester carboxylesterase [Streptomyces aidingensis]
MAETMVRVGDAELCTESFGDPLAPMVLLIAGGACSMDWWDAGFCRRLADGGRFVVRYDHRDTGRSTGCPPGAPAYTGSDLTGDAAGLIEALGDGGRAHVVGLSMGGGIAQHLAAEHAARVATLTLMSTSPAFPLVHEARLPPMADRLRAVFDAPAAEPDWSDGDAVVDYVAEQERPYAGPDFFDETWVRAVARRAVGRTANPEAAMKNHWILAEGEDGATHRLDEVTAPVLVVHGSEDPLFPPGHAHALVREIPGAQLLMLEGFGHQAPPPAVWDLLVPALLRHTAPDPALRS